MILREAPPEHYGWMAERAEVWVRPGFRAMEVVDGERILGMVGFDGWHQNSCAMHVALDPSLSGRRALGMLIRPAFRFVFESCGLGVAIATVLGTNKPALRLTKHLGFREVAIGRDWYAKGVDLVWLEMRAEECSWLTAQRKAA